MAITSCFRPQALAFGKADILGAKVLDIELREPLSGRMQSVCRLLTKPHRLMHLLPPSRSRAEWASEAVARAASESPSVSSASSIPGETSVPPSAKISAAERRRRRKVGDGDHSENSASVLSSYSEPRQADSLPTTTTTPEVGSKSAWGASEEERQGALGRTSEGAAMGAGSPARQERAAYRTRGVSPLEGFDRNGGVESVAGPRQRNLTAGEAKARQFGDAVRFLNKDSGG